MITGKYPSLRLRRTRKYDWSRRLIQENNLSCNDLVYPIFVVEGKNRKQPIETMPGINRYSVDQLGIIVNNVLILEIDSRGILAKKDFYDLEDMKNIKFDKKQTQTSYSKSNFIYDFLSSMRQKINDPLGKRKRREDIRK